MFLDDFREPQRERLTEVAVELQLDPGQYLIRRGDPGGDVFLVVGGELEVVDDRRAGVVQLARLGPGAVVGELAFLNDSPRAADVRAGGRCRLLRWGRDDLHRLLKLDEALAAVFYRRVAVLAARRMQNLTQTALSGALSPASVGSPGATTAARRVAESAKEALIGAENGVRSGDDPSVVRQRLVAGLDALQVAVADLTEAWPDPGSHRVAARVLDVLEARR